MNSWLVADAAMDLGTLPGWITAVATLFTALGGLLVIVKTIVPTKHQVDQVHVIVNQQRTDMERYIRVLSKALESAGIDLPEDQSKLD